LNDAFGRVLLVRSKLTNSQSQLTAGATFFVGASAFQSPAAAKPRSVSAVVKTWYTYTIGSRNGNGFSGSTAGDPRTIERAADFTPTHTFQVSMTGQADGWGSATLTGRVASGLRYAPMIASDVNGDGLANDRAFIFDPEGQSDLAFASGLRSALKSNGSCLNAQRGRIAAAASCVGAWTVGLGTLVIAPDPFRFGFGNRGSITLVVDNLLSGLDELLHGADRMAGWGGTGFPDQNLLTVRSFDAARRTFLYAVNPHFGRTGSARGGNAPPMRISIDARLDIGRNREAQAIESELSYMRQLGAPLDSVTLFGRLIRQPPGARRDDIAGLLALKDSLKLDDSQIMRLEQLRARRDSLRAQQYGRLAGALARTLERTEPRQWHEAVASVTRNHFEYAHAARTLLTESQLARWRLRYPDSSLEYSAAWLERILKAYLIFP
jgi:hypothetical protein